MIFTLFSVLVIRNFSKTRKTVQRGISYRGIETGCTAMGQYNMNYPIVPLAWSVMHMAHVSMGYLVSGSFTLQPVSEQASAIAVLSI